MEYEYYNMVELMARPPLMWHNQGDFQTMGKVVGDTADRAHSLRQSAEP